MDPDGKIVISGPQTFPLDKDGTLSVPIPASNDPDLGPAFTYSIEVNLTHASWKISKVWIPHGSATVDLSEIGDYTPTPGVPTRTVTIPADGEDGQVLVWDGAGFVWADVPEGPPGEVTTEALTTALAGKVTGTGMTLRHDTTVGERVLLDHPGGTTMLSGDTGWRELPVTPDWEGATLVARRVGNTVELRLFDTARPTPATTLVASLPAGFRPIRLVPAPYQENGGVMSKLMAVSTTVAAYNRTSGATMSSGAIIFLTTDPWPATLPGVPS